MAALITLFNIVLAVLAKAIRQREKTKSIQIEKKEIKPSLFTDNMILYIENLKNFTKKLLELIMNSVNQQDTKLISDICSIFIHQ